MEDRARAICKKRDLEGNTSVNSFAALSNPELMLRARKMGVMIPDMEFSKIDIHRELENVRNNAVEKPTPPDEVMLLTNENGETIPVDMRWGDDLEGDTSDFTVVGPRKKRSSKKNTHAFI